MGKHVDLTGQTFGRLTAIEYIRSNNGLMKWLCRCECQNEKLVFGSDLRSGRTKSCGCLRRETTSSQSRRHGLSTDSNGHKQRLYRIWKQMRQRCLNQNDSAYERYGGRGITICPEWNEYMNFYHWAIYNGYNDSLSIDRRENDGNYDPGNCRWADSHEQARNKRNNLIVVYKEETRTLVEWADILDLPIRTLKSRLRLGWTVEDTLSKPIRRMNHVRRKTVDINS